MSNFELPTFDPDRLPEESTLQTEANTDFMLVEQGVSPHEVAKDREQVRLMSNRVIESVKRELEEYRDNE